MVDEVLQRLERDEHVDRVVIDRNLRRRTLAKAEIVARVSLRRVCHRRRIDIYADDVGRDLGQQSRAVAFTRRDIEYAPATAEMAGHVVAVEVLDLGFERVAGG